MIGRNLISALGAALLVTMATAGVAGADADGAGLFKTKCASCHGKDATGNEKMAKMFKLEPAAMNLIDADTQKQSDADLTKTTTEGKGTKMVGFGKKLSGDEIAAVVAYVRSLGNGAKTFAAKCMSCHGQDGTGNEKMAKMFKLDASALDLIDADTQGQSDADLAKSTKDGKGSKMAAFGKKLSDDEIADVVAYMRALKAGAKKK